MQQPDLGNYNGKMEVLCTKLGCWGILKQINAVDVNKIKIPNHKPQDWDIIYVIGGCSLLKAEKTCIFYIILDLKQSINRSYIWST